MMPTDAIASWRDEFPVTRQWFYLNHAGIGPLAGRAAQRMGALAASVAASGDRQWPQRNDEAERVRALGARLLGARRPQEVAFVENTSTALSAVAEGLDWRPGDNVVGAAGDFPSNVYPWMHLADRGVEYRVVAEREGRIDPAEVVAAIDGRTRAVALSWVQYATGFRHDLARIGAACRAADALFVVDAIQGLGALAFDVERDLVDVAAASAHKWLLGPEGIALLYVSDRVIERLRPTRSGWRSMRDMLAWTEFDVDWADGAKRLESGTLNTYGVHGLGGSLDLLLAAGAAAIEARVLALAERAAAGLTACGLRLAAPRRAGETSGIVTATHPTIAAQTLVDRLLEQRIVTAARAGRLRIAPHFYNTEDEIDRCLAAINQAITQPARVAVPAGTAAPGATVAADGAASGAAGPPASSARASASAVLAPARGLFEIPDGVTFLNCANMAPQLRAVTAAGLDAVRAKAAPWRLSSAEWFTGAEELRGLAAQVMGADADGVALVPAASYGIAVAAANLPCAAGQTIVVLDQQFPSNVYAWRELAQKRQGQVVTALRQDGESWTAALLRAIDDRTAIVAVPPCHWTDGSRVDLAAVGARARAVGAALVVDASQFLGAGVLDLAAVQPDFLVAVGYKWLLGPYGLGYLYAAPRWRNAGVPLEHSWLARAGSEDFSSLTLYTDAYRPGARRFDMGEFPQFVLAPMAIAALRQLLAWGVPAIEAALKPLTDRAAQHAADLGYGILPAAERSAHMIGVRPRGGLAAALPQALRDARVHVSIRGDSIRIAPHLYNDQQDIDRLFDVLRRTAA